MLQTLRNNTRIILWVVVIAFVGFIILVWGADLQVGSSKQGIAGSVNGRDITYQFYEGRVRTNVQDVQTRNDRPATFEEERRISEQTWQSIVDEILIAQEAEKYALPVSDEEVVYWIENNPPPELLQHPAMIDSATGQFNLARYLQLLRTEPQSFRGYEQLTRYQLPVTKLQQNVVSAAKVSDAEVETYIRDRNETMRASFTWVDPKQFPGRGTEVSEDEARAYYEAHPDEFRSEERARMVVVRLPKEPSQLDENEVLEEVRSFAGSIAAGEASFSGIAESFSEDAFTAQGGDRGRPLRREEIEPELADRVFTVPPGQMSEPFRIGNRVLLVQVSTDTLIDDQPARRFATIERRIRPGADRQNELRALAREIFGQASREGLSAAAAAAGAQVDTTALFERSSFTPLLIGAREAVDFAFENPPGSVGRPIENETDLVIFQVLERREAEVLPMDEVRPRVERAVIRERQHEMAREKATRLLTALQTKGSLAAAAKAETLNVRDSTRFARKGFFGDVGRDPDLIAAAFTLPVGTVSDLIETDNGFFIVRADSLFLTTAEEMDQQRPAARQTLERERQTQALQAWIEDLRSRAQIEDYRQRYF
jgi:peptidylprolyl isomerase/peptidyl-prolyl cis-trans isomerase D